MRYKWREWQRGSLISAKLPKEVKISPFYSRQKAVRRHRSTISNTLLLLFNVILVVIDMLMLMSNESPGDITRVCWDASPIPVGTATPE